MCEVTVNLSETIRISQDCDSEFFLNCFYFHLANPQKHYQSDKTGCFFLKYLQKKKKIMC